MTLIIFVFLSLLWQLNFAPTNNATYNELSTELVHFQSGETVHLFRAKRATREKSNFRYKPTSTIKDSSGRVTKKTGIIKHVGDKKGSGTPVKHNPAIKTRMRVMDKKKDDQIGHIVADKHGGKGDNPNNVFPQNKQINQGFWKTQEYLISKKVLAEHAPVKATHELFYDGNGKRPVAISVKLQSESGKDLGEFHSFNPEKSVKNHQSSRYRSKMQTMANKIKLKYRKLDAKRQNLLAKATKSLKSNTGSNSKLGKLAKKATSALKTIRAKSLNRISSRLRSQSTGKISSRLRSRALLG